MPSCRVREKGQGRQKYLAPPCQAGRARRYAAHRESALARQSSWQSPYCLNWECYFRQHRCLIRNVTGDPAVLEVAFWGDFGDKPTLPDFLFFQCTKKPVVVAGFLWDSWARGRESVGRRWVNAPALSTGSRLISQGARMSHSKSRSESGSVVDTGRAPGSVSPVRRITKDRGCIRCGVDCTDEVSFEEDVHAVHTSGSLEDVRGPFFEEAREPDAQSFRCSQCRGRRNSCPCRVRAR